MDINNVYNLVNPQVIETLCAVDNPFIRQLAHLSSEQAKQLKTTSFVLKNIANNRGEIAQRGIHSQDKSVIDITKLTPLVDNQNFRTLQEEIAYVRNWQLQMHNTLTHPTWWKDNAEMLMVDYLLASCLCYIEIFDNTANVEKYFATRNRFIAGSLTNMTPMETSKYTNYLQSFSNDFEKKQLKVLKITATKNAFKITQPRSYVDFTRQIKITPVFLMTTFMDGIQDTIAQGVLRFRYLKDNLTEREFITTTNPALLIQTYGEDFTQKMVHNMASQLNRGYVKLPEFGISRFDYSGVRALNVSRITQVERINPQDVDLSFVNIDFDNILPSIKQGVYDIHSQQVLQLVYEELSGQSVPPHNSTVELKTFIDQFIDAQHAIGTTTALRHMHRYMTARPQFFPRYNSMLNLPHHTVQQPSHQPQLQQQQMFVDPTSAQQMNPLENFGETMVVETPSFVMPKAEDTTNQQTQPQNLFGTAFNLGGASD